VTLDEACTTHGQPTNSIHCPDLGAKGKEKQKAAREDVEENCWLYSSRGEKPLIQARKSYLNACF